MQLLTLGSVSFYLSFSLFSRAVMNMTPTLVECLNNIIQCKFSADGSPWNSP